jgi:hypothetical protein
MGRIFNRDNFLMLTQIQTMGRSKKAEGIKMLEPNEIRI